MKYKMALDEHRRPRWMTEEQLEQNAKKKQRQRAKAEEEFRRRKEKQAGEGQQHS